jgi:dUTP pyrophosphatase
VLKAKVKMIDKSLPPFERHGNGDMFDVRVSGITVIDPSTKKGIRVDLGKGDPFIYGKDETMIIHLGFAMECPAGFKAHVYPRSSTFKTYGLIQTNGVGIIDNSYAGDNDEWGFPCYSVRGGLLHQGERIGQFEFTPIYSADFEYVDALGNKDRGGIGSTGVK